MDRGSYGIFNWKKSKYVCLLQQDHLLSFQFQVWYLAYAQLLVYVQRSTSIDIHECHFQAAISSLLLGRLTFAALCNSTLLNYAVKIKVLSTVTFSLTLLLAQALTNEFGFDCSVCFCILVLRANVCLATYNHQHYNLINLSSMLDLMLPFSFSRKHIKTALRGNVFKQTLTEYYHCFC